MKSINKALLLLLLITSSTLPFSLKLFAQTAGTQAEKATVVMDEALKEQAKEQLRTRPKKKPEIKEEKKKEAKEEGPTFHINKIILDGVKSVSLDEFKSVLAKYENRTVSFEELSILAKLIEREYLKRGIVAACFVPPQEIKDGTVTLKVVESKMGDLEVKDHKFFKKDRVNFYWQLKKGQTLRYDKISRSLQHMNMNPDREVKATLHAGKEPGTTDVLLDVKTYFPFHGTFSFDKEGSTYTGLAKTGFGGKHNNFLGLDDTFLSGFMFGDHFYGIYAYHKVPITNFGTSILYGYSYSKSAPKKDFDRFGLKSMSDSTSFFIHQDLFEKDRYAGEVFAGFDAKNKLVKQHDLMTNRDKLRILRFGGNFLYRKLGTITYISPEYSQGLDTFGARQKNFHASRMADNNFSKFKLGIKHKLSLPFNLRLALNMKGQYVPKKLTPQEQLSLGGIDSVRGYPTGDYLADIAFQSNSEILFPAFFIPKSIKFPFASGPLRDDITGVVFVDYAYGQRRDALGAEEQRMNLMSVGGGMRIRVFNQGLLRLEWGAPISSDEPTTGSTTLRLHISLNFEDKLQAELERIDKIIKAKKHRNEKTLQ